MTTKISGIDILEIGAKGKESSSPWSSTMAILRLTTSDGMVGYGEAPTTLMTLPVIESMKEVARFFEGADYLDLNHNLDTFYRNSFYLSRSMEATSALSAFEIASMDLIGKHFGAPVYDLLGGIRRDRIRVYANGWYSDCITEEDFVSRAKEVHRKGFTAVKFDPFGASFDTITPEGLKKAESIVSSLRSEFGDKMDLLIECHGRFSLKAAKEILDVMGRRGSLFVEEPLHPELSHLLAELRRHSSTPVALGERILDKEGFAELVSRNLVDVIQPDITNCLGITGGQAISQISDSFGVPVAFHNAFGPIQTAATLNLDHSIRNFLIQESFEEFWPDWKRKLVKSGYRIEKGHARLEGKPGIGVDVDEKLLDSHIVAGMEPVDKSEPPWVVAGTFSKARKYES
ncbi:MAG: mandelate racemase/muconate lactonizing enzyme family protein [Candidatus Thermoplasmatota archaeon]|nr:mandelate racemase/muconate lactonizing enzyme family protein [Candidatus Thermoplasmatota archaeon]